MKRLLAMNLLFACSLVTAVPPLRVAIPAGSQGLNTARLWTALALEFGSYADTALQPIIIPDDETALTLLSLRQADLAVLDPLTYLSSAQGYELLGVLEHYGRPTEAFVLIASMESIIHRTEDLWRARLMLVGPKTGLSWTYPLVWTETSLNNYYSRSEPIEADSYAGLLKGVALGNADAGFLPEGFYLGISDSLLAARVRVLDVTAEFPLSILVARTDMATERSAAAKQLIGLKIEGLGISSPTQQTHRSLAELVRLMSLAEVKGVTQP
jgi:ABC-type phosphate/phosphonate transport system substrate-binding protein